MEPGEGGEERGWRAWAAAAAGGGDKWAIGGFICVQAFEMFSPVICNITPAPCTTLPRNLSTDAHSDQVFF